MERRRQVRRSAAIFAVASLPATAMIIAVGGIIGIAPVLALLVAMIVLGRVPGEESLQRLIERRAPRRRRHPRLRARRPAFMVFTHPVRGLLLASAMAERGPPALGQLR